MNRPTVLVGLLLALAGCNGGNDGPAPAPTPEPDHLPQTSYTTTYAGQTHTVTGNRYTTTGYRLSDEFWATLEPPGKASLVRGYLDGMVSPLLLDWPPARARMRKFATEFFGKPSPTQLIPYPMNVQATDQGVMTGGKQPLRTAALAMEFPAWFPEDAALRGKATAIVKASVKHFTANTPGLWGWCDVTTGEGSAKAWSRDFGALAVAVHRYGNLTDDRSLWPVIERRLQWTWDNRGWDLPLPPDFYGSSGPLASDKGQIDADALYYVNRLYDVFRASGTERYRAWALAATDTWMQRAWLPQHRHFTRKVWPDGRPPTPRIYGDAKYNSLRILLNAYDVTREPKYLARYKEAWAGLKSRGVAGLMPAQLDSGKLVGDMDTRQTVFLDIAMQAYAVTRDPAMLAEARRLGDAILLRGPSVMVLEGGQAGEAFMALGAAFGKAKVVE